MTMHSVPDRETDQRARARHHGRLIAGATKIRSPAWNRVLGSDPGLLRLRSALQAVTTIGVAMVAGWLFVDLTHAMSVGSHGAVLSPQEQAIVASRDHAVTLVAVMLGAMVGMIASFFGALFPTPRSTVVNFALIPVPMVPGLALGLALGDHRVLALGSRAVVRDVGAYCRRFGPSGLLGGGLLFMGTFIGFFLHEQAGIEDIGWLTAEVAIGAAVAVVAHFTVFYPSRRAALRRMLRSFGVRSHEVSARALRLFTCPANRRAQVARSLRRRILRLNETALLIDAQLGHESAVPAQWSAGELHHRLFDVELTLSTLARLTERITELDLPADLRAQVRGALAAVSDLDVARVEASGRELLRLLRATPTAADGAEQGLDRGAHIVLHRFATSVLGFAEAAQGSRRSAATVEDGSVRGPFTPSVTAFGGWLPGSAIVSATASLDTTGPRPSDRVRLQPHIRATIQMGVAIVAAIVLGNLLSGRHFYWAVIAAFVTFMGANNAGEQLRKRALRLLGTVVGVFLGVFLGALGAHLVGRRTAVAIAVILVSLFLATYLTIGITVLASQLYVQLDEFSGSLLRLRVEETALGVGIAAVHRAVRGPTEARPRDPGGGACLPRRASTCRPLRASSSLESIDTCPALLTRCFPGAHRRAPGNESVGRWSWRVRSWRPSSTFRGGDAGWYRVRD